MPPGDADKKRRAIYALGSASGPARLVIDVAILGDLIECGEARCTAANGALVILTLSEGARAFILRDLEG